MSTISGKKLYIYIPIKQGYTFERSSHSVSDSHRFRFQSILSFRHFVVSRVLYVGNIIIYLNKYIIYDL